MRPAKTAGCKALSAFIILIQVCFLTLVSCQKPYPGFAEKVIDDQAPEHLWMKTISDINGDGKTDILVGGWQSGGLVAYIAPDWEKLTINDSLRISTDAEVCDVNSDGINDMVVLVYQAIIWMEGPNWSLHLVDSIVGHDVEVHDFDKDGRLDIVARNQGAFGDEGGHTLYFYRQDPPDTWTRYEKEIPDGEGLKMADVDNDGRMDMVTNGSWFENTGNLAEWIEHPFTNTWKWPHTLVDVADINSDGRVDILLSPSEHRGNYYHISWFEAPEDVTSIWAEHIVVDSVETVCHAIRAGDFDRDGNIDIAVAETHQSVDPDEVMIFYSQGDNTWQKVIIGTGGSHSIRVFDADDDGDLDIFGANFVEHVVKMWVNQGK